MFFLVRYHTNIDNRMRECAEFVLKFKVTPRFETDERDASPFSPKSLFRTERHHQMGLRECFSVEQVVNVQRIIRIVLIIDRHLILSIGGRGVQQRLAEQVACQRFRWHCILSIDTSAVDDDRTNLEDHPGGGETDDRFLPLFQRIRRVISLDARRYTRCPSVSGDAG